MSVHMITAMISIAKTVWDIPWTVDSNSARRTLCAILPFVYGPNITLCIDFPPRTLSSYYACRMIVGSSTIAVPTGTTLEEAVSHCRETFARYVSELRCVPLPEEVIDEPSDL